MYLDIAPDVSVTTHHSWCWFWTSERLKQLWRYCKCINRVINIHDKHRRKAKRTSSITFKRKQLNSFMIPIKIVNVGWVKLSNVLRFHSSQISALTAFKVPKLYRLTGKPFLFGGSCRWWWICYLTHCVHLSSLFRKNKYHDFWGEVVHRKLQQKQIAYC